MKQDDANRPDEPEEDPWEDGFEGECERCGRIRIVQRCSDPYMSELYPDEPAKESYWCRECFGRRADDI